MQVIEILVSNTSSHVYAMKSDEYKKGDRVVFSSNSQLDLGVIVGTTDTTDLIEFVEIVRVATPDDIKANCENCRFAKSILPEIKQQVNNLNLDMKIAFVAVSLDKSKITVNYTSDERVDFRELIKILGSKYKARIEMKQIGNRDESKHIGAMGVCGRETCCKSFLKDFDKVSIKMAKNQNISLNPTRINGMCGRLLCCLKYEDEYYAEMQKKMPKIGILVTTPDGKGSVQSTDFLRETVTVSFQKDDITELKTYPLSEIKLGKDNSKEKQKK